MPKVKEKYKYTSVVETYNRHTKESTTTNICTKEEKEEHYDRLLKHMWRYRDQARISRSIFRSATRVDNILYINIDDLNDDQKKLLDKFEDKNNAKKEV